jgi:hypothetical protein
MTYERSLIKLNDLDEPFFDILKVVLKHESFNFLLNFSVNLVWNICLKWEDISDER